MKTITLRRQSGSSRNGWVRNEDTKEFVNPARTTHTANSGNQTLEWELEPGKYTIQEIWYGKKDRRTIIVKE